MKATRRIFNTVKARIWPHHDDIPRRNYQKVILRQGFNYRMRRHEESVKMKCLPCRNPAKCYI